MNECCKETYKKTLEELRLTIKKLGITNIHEVLGMLNVAIFNLEDKENINVKYK